jgi:hypothetical protein
VKALLISIQKHKALSTSSHYEEQRYVFWNCNADRYSRAR